MLDVVRFGAACLVLLHHAAIPKFGTYLPYRLAMTGTEPVMAFFVLSGFVIALTAETTDRTADQYLLSRAARLLSVTIPAIALTVALDYLGDALSPALYADHWTDPATVANLHMPLSIRLGATASFLNEIWGLDVWPGTNSPFWSLGYEAAYYLIFGLAFYGRSARARAIWIASACILVGPKVLLLLPIWLMGVGAWHIYKRLAIPPLGGALLCAGATLLYVAFIGAGARSGLDGISEALTAGMSPGMIGLSNHFLSNYVSGLLFSCVLIGLKGLQSALSSALSRAASAIRAAAQCTFSMYLYHYPLIHFFRAAAASLTGEHDPSFRGWEITGIVLVGTCASIYGLARITEQRKGELRRLLARLPALRRPQEAV